MKHLNYTEKDLLSIIEAAQQQGIDIIGCTSYLDNIKVIINGDLYYCDSSLNTLKQLINHFKV